MLAELIVRPLLRDEDIAKERDIIVEEIRSYRDDPAQYVYNLFDEAFFGDSPLGWEIAGDEESVRAMPEAAIRAFWSGAYRPANVVVAVAGDMAHGAVVDLVRDAFGTGNGVVPGSRPLRACRPARGSSSSRAGRTVAPLPGLAGPPAGPPRHVGAGAAEHGPGRWLQQPAVPEHPRGAGLAYDVHSFQTDFADTGTLQIYAGVDPGEMREALEAVLGELARLRDETVSQEELEKARAYAKGRLELRLEESRHIAAWLGGQEALHEQVLTLDEALAALDAVTVEDVQALAGRLFRDEVLTLAVIAPARRSRTLEQALRLP